MVSHYRVLEELGGGGMGVVFKAEDVRLGRIVALKVLREELLRDPVMRDRFQREARAAARLNHPNICTLFDVLEVDGRPFLAMEYLDGEALDRRLARGPLGIGTLLDFALQIAEGLEPAHLHGIIHRDIKPANIFVTADNRIKIMDFGLAKVLDASRMTQASSDRPADETVAMSAALLTNPGVRMGTVAYMSPEQACGEERNCTEIVRSLVFFEVLIDEIHNESPVEVAALLCRSILQKFGAGSMSRRIYCEMN